MPSVLWPVFILQWPRPQHKSALAKSITLSIASRTTPSMNWQPWKITPYTYIFDCIPSKTPPECLHRILSGTPGSALASTLPLSAPPGRHTRSRRCRGRPTSRPPLGTNKCNIPKTVYEENMPKTFVNLRAPPNQQDLLLRFCGCSSATKTLYMTWPRRHGACTHAHIQLRVLASSPSRRG